MATVNPWVERLFGLVIANVFLVKTARGRRLLVDTGYVLERPALLAALRRRGIGPGQLDGVLLTHRHSDHAGNAAFFQRHGVKVYAHRADAQVLAQPERSLPLRRRGNTPHDFFAQALGILENHFPARLEPDVVLEDGADVFGLEVRWMPGHTEGSAFFHHHQARTLFSGDTLLAAVPPLVYRAGLALPYASFSVDWERSLRSLRAFLEARPGFDTLCAGHGRPVAGDAEERVFRFLEQVLPGERRAQRSTR